LKTVVVALGLFVPWLLLQAALVPPLAAQDVVVSAADPPSAPQGTTNLSVVIKGKNFKRGAESRFFETGTADPGGVTVKSTTFVSRTELLANVDIADTATLSKFDIEVQNADGRTGKGIEVFTVTEKTNAVTDVVARADFREGSDRIRSDGQPLPDGCLPGDYADATDPCGPGHPGVSYVYATGMYFLRTLSGHPRIPTRWLVLDFGDPLEGSACPDLDTKLKAYSGRNPTAFSPETAELCIDWVEVRLSADKAFAPGAEFTPVGLVIDGPDASTIQSTGVQWNGKYYLDFVNPLTITRQGAATAILDTMGDAQAQLWTVNPRNGKRQTLVGTYMMPFRVTIAARP
jgi:hypothetical protein